MSRSIWRSLAVLLPSTVVLGTGVALAQPNYQPAHQRAGINQSAYSYNNGTIRQVVGTGAAAASQAAPVGQPGVNAAGASPAAMPPSVLVGGQAGSVASHGNAPQARVAQAMPGNSVMVSGIPGGVVLGPGETIVSGNMPGAMMGGYGDSMVMSDPMMSGQMMSGGMMGGAPMSASMMGSPSMSGSAMSGGMMGDPMFMGDAYGSSAPMGGGPVGCADGSCGVGGMSRRPLLGSMMSQAQTTGVGGQRYGEQCYDGVAYQPMMPQSGLARMGNFCVFAGTTAFTGPSNLGASGSFGFHEGFIYSAPVFGVPNEAISFEGGARFVQANLGGNLFTDENRYQIFGTVGLFRRVDWGLQGGVVADYFREDWYTTTDLVQLRGEISWIYPSGYHEIGAFGTRALNKSGREGAIALPSIPAPVPLTPTFDSKAMDTYNLFYRAKFPNNGSGRAVVGVTELGNFLVGADFETPLTERIAIDSTFRYIIPKERQTVNVFDATPENIESWNLGLSIRVCLDPRRMCGGYHRALLPVADNGSFFVNRSIR